MKYHSAHRTANRWRPCEPLFAVVGMLACCLVFPLARSQEPNSKSAVGTSEAKSPKAKEPPLYEQKPFDVVILDEANKNAKLKVFPLLFPNRRVPINPSANLVVDLMDDESDDQFEIAWRNIHKVELFEELLLNEGNRLRDESQALVDGKPKSPEEKERLLDEAFHYYFRVEQSDPTWPSLKESINRYLFFDAANLNTQQRYAEAFSVIEELYSRNPNFKLRDDTAPISDVMSRVLDRILAEYFESKNYLGLRTLIVGMKQKYGNQKPASVDTWASQLNQLAAQKRDQGREHLDAQRYRDAIASVKEMNAIWPDVEGGKELDVAVANAYPIVFVGVTQPALDYDAQQLDNWPARRTGRLVHRTLVEFLGAGPEGGQYQLSAGSIEHSDDRLRLILRLKQPSGEQPTEVTGYEVDRRIRQLATDSAPDYSPAWAALVSGVSVKNVYTVEVELQRPHVLPEALLRVPLTFRARQSEPAASGDGPFRVQARTETEIRFAHKSFAPGSRLAEVVELSYNDSQKGVGALRRGEIDVLDRLFPADALRLRADASLDAAIKIEPYSLPTVHLLVPNLKNPFLINRNIRRAILQAINRENILRQELMGGKDYPGFQVISGPFPASAGDADPLGYAYDESTPPKPYNPLLAKALILVGQKEVVEMATKRGDPAPKLTRIVLGFPGHEMARVASQAITAQLQLIGLQVEMREFPPGVSDDLLGDCDLIYKEIAIWEPVTDARRMMGARGVTPTQSPYVLQSLLWLDQAENWGEVRERLVDIHRAVDYDVALLPLWQTIDFFAYHKRLKNIGASPVWLYQNIDQWRIGAGAGAE